MSKGIVPERTQSRWSIAAASQLITTAVAARMLQMTPDGVRWLARTEQIAYEQTGSQQRVFRRSEVLRVAELRTKARGRTRAELLAEVRPKMLRAGLEPRQTRIKLVTTKAKGHFGIPK